MVAPILTRKFALLPKGTIKERNETIKSLRKQFIKFRDFQNLYTRFLVNLVRDTPSIVHNKPYEYPNFHLTITAEHRAEFTRLKEEGNLPSSETLPTSAKMRLRKYIYDFYSDPTAPSLNLSAFETESYRSLPLIERAKQNALQYPFYAVRNWIIRNERLKTIGHTLRELLTSKGSREIYYRKTKTHLMVKEASYTLERLLGGKGFHREFLGKFYAHTKANIFGEVDSPSYEYLSNHIGQFRNLLLKSKGLDRFLREELQRLRGDETAIEAALRGVLTPILLSYERKGTTPQDYFLSLFIRRLRARTTKLAKHRLRRGRALQGASLEVSLVNELFSDHTFKSLSDFKKVRARYLNNAHIEEAPEYALLSPSELIARVKDMVLEFLDGILSNPQIHPAKALFKPSFPGIRITSFDMEGFSAYYVRRLFYILKERILELFSRLGLVAPLKECLLTEISSICAALYDITSTPRFTKLTIPLTVTEYIYEPPDPSLQVRFGMEKRKGKEFTLSLSEKNRARFEAFYIPAFKTVRGIVKDNLRNPVLQLKGRKLLLCQPFATQTGIHTPEPTPPTHSSEGNTSSSGGAVEIGVDLGVKHFAVLSVMDKSLPKGSQELRRYYLGQKALYDMKFYDDTGTFHHLSVVQSQADGSTRSLEHLYHPTNIKGKLIRLRREHRHIQRLRSEYEARHPDDYWRRLKWYHRSKTESCLWDKLQRLNKDIIDRLSGLIVRIARFHGAACVRFEDLRWSKHQLKRRKGKFIAFWQTHWFHSQVQSMVAQGAARHGIRSVVVDAFMTSQRCAVCGRRGIRRATSTKLFHCLHCRSTVDADLNAARNIVQGAIVYVLSPSLPSLG